MEKNKPLELALDLLKHSNMVCNNEYRFVTPDFGIVISFANMESHLFRLGQPYRLKEGRIIRGLRGKARIIINLIEYTVYPQTIVTFIPGSIVELLEFTPDYDFQMIAVDKDFLPLLRRDQLFESHVRQKLVTRVTDTEWKLSDAYFTLIWETVQEKPFRREVVQHLLAALLHNIKYIRTEEANDASHRFSHQEEIFWRFITLVNESSKNERTVGFYADKLCLTPRYLNTLIRQVSHQTVMEWINQSVILEAKVLLKHSDLLVYQISDELHFPNPSFFCKFFKRMTGMTPQEYQKR